MYLLKEYKLHSVCNMTMVILMCAHLLLIFYVSFLIKLNWKSNQTKLDQIQSPWHRPRVLVRWSCLHGHLNLRAAVIIRAFRAHILNHRTERPWTQSSRSTKLNEVTHSWSYNSWLNSVPWPCFCDGSKSESELELELELDGLDGADC